MKDDEPDRKRITIGIVGPCGAGKSTLIDNLVHPDYNLRHIAQEHSYVADMWKRISNPDLLIFLEVDYETIGVRKSFSFTRKEYQDQMARLQHAYTHADLIIDTTNRTPEQISSIASEFIKNSI
jgi:deoxyadenosine/deoxycytidine kinase